LRFWAASSNMGSVRLTLALVLALRLSGVPAVLASPCAASPDAASECCIKHQTATGGPVIGACGCPAPASVEAREGACVSPSASDRIDAPASVALLLPVAPGARPSCWRPDAVPAPLDTSPPRLSGTGFRC
jgi:hypothetical protein